jgi:hypothetical protein
MQLLVATSTVLTLLNACAKKNNYDTFDTSQYAASNQQYVYLKNSLNTQSTVVINATVSGSTVTALSNDSLSLYLNTAKPVSGAISGSVVTDETLVATYNAANNTSYTLLPSAAYTLANNTGLSVAAGASSSSNGALLKLNKAALAQGSQYLLPVKVSAINGSIDISTNQNVVYVAVNVPLANTASTAKPGGYKQILYVEVNDNNPLNALNYNLTNSKTPFFDVVNIFAANINYDNVKQKPYVYFNQQVTAILSNRQKYIVPLQAKGMKVCLALLCNHQGVGFDNFTSSAGINDFVQQVKKIVDDYQLDGIDIDDEYAQYGTNGQPAVNDSSLVLLVKRFREVMPNKIISYYYFSDAVSIPKYAQWNGLTVGQYIDYTYQGSYNRYSVPSMPGLTDKSKIGAYSLNLSSPQTSTSFNTNVNNVKTNGYGGTFMWYNLGAADQVTSSSNTKVNLSTYFTYVSNLYYGETVTYNNQPYAKDY